MRHFKPVIALPGLFAAVIFATTAAAAPLTSADVAKLRTVGSVKLSPNGKHLAYTVNVPRAPFSEDSGSGYSELHLLDVASGVSRPFITGKVSIRGVYWTPDGSGIAFLDKRGKDKNKSLYVLPVSGGEAQRVLTAKTSISGFALSPDGKRAAYYAKPKQDKNDKELHDKGFNQEVVEEEWVNNELFVAELDRYQPDASVEAEDAEHAKVELEGHISSVSWSPSGKHLLVGIAKTPWIDDHYMNTRYHLVDVKSMKDVASYKTPGKLGMTKFSPDGTKVAMIVADDRNDPSAGRLAIGEIPSGKHAVHLSDYEGDVIRLDWVDNTRLALMVAEGSESAVKTIGADGKDLKTVVPKGKHIFFSIEVGNDGKTAVLNTQSHTHPSEAYSLDLASGATKRLTNVNPWLGKRDFAKQELVTFKAKDGMPIEGILIHPLKKTKKAPLIVVVHGGPEAHMRNGWLTYYSYPGQVAAAEGFAVFHPNYRGSTGRGVAFSKLGQADYAGKEFDDIIDGIDHLASQGLIDPKKVGVTGGSYGGFASAWMATKHTKRFAASVMFVGISDQISKFGTTDIPNEMRLVHSRKWPWEDWNFFRERSPIMYTPQARTPILIMHGKNDTRVHPTQSMELFRYLKTIGKVPVRLVLYPGEGHGNRKSAARLDYNLRMLRWMKHYLMGKGGDAPDRKIDYSAFKPKKDDDEKDEKDKKGKKGKKGK